MDNFDIPLGRISTEHMQAVFATAEFQNGLPPAPPPPPPKPVPPPKIRDEPVPKPIVITKPEPEKLSDAEMAWVNETLENGQPLAPAPTRAAEKYLRTEFKRYDFPMPVTEEQWRNFVLMKWYTLANDPDPKIAKAALDSIAKSAAANLMVEKKEISITTRSDEELNKELKDLFASLKAKANEKVITGTAERV
jgi:hypothetical protein